VGWGRGEGGGGLARGGGRGWAEKEITLLEGPAARAGAAIENAQLYERQHHVASTLQQAFLPADFPYVPGGRFDAVYASGQDGTEIGVKLINITLPNAVTVVTGEHPRGLDGGETRKLVHRHSS